MELRTVKGRLIIKNDKTESISDLLREALDKSKSLRGVNLRGKYIKGVDLSWEDLCNADIRNCNLFNCDLYHTDFRGAVTNSNGPEISSSLSNANLQGMKFGEKVVKDMKVFDGLYVYRVWAVLFTNGERYIRMGCLYKKLETWERIGIRKSNTGEFPNDGSDRSEERFFAYEFAKAAVLRMK